jgi:hypothetical protein
VNPFLHFGRRSSEIDAEHSNAVRIDFTLQTVGDRFERVLG